MDRATEVSRDLLLVRPSVHGLWVLTADRELFVLVASGTRVGAVSLDAETPTPTRTSPRVGGPGDGNPT